MRLLSLSRQFRPDISTASDHLLGERFSHWQQRGWQRTRPSMAGREVGGGGRVTCCLFFHFCLFLWRRLGVLLKVNLRV